MVELTEKAGIAGCGVALIPTRVDDSREDEYRARRLYCNEGGTGVVIFIDSGAFADTELADRT